MSTGSTTTTEGTAAAGPAAGRSPWADDDGETVVTSAGHLPEWRLLVAPLAGTFRSASPDTAGADSGATVGTTTELGHVVARSDRRPVIPQWRGAILEWLVKDGDPVSPGQPLARLLPEGAE